MKKRDYNEGFYELKLIDIRTHLRSCNYKAWADGVHSKPHAFKFRCQRCRIVPRPGYQYSLF